MSLDISFSNIQRVLKHIYFIQTSTMIDYGFKWPIQYLISRNANSMGIKWPLLVFDQSSRLISIQLVRIPCMWWSRERILLQIIKQNDRKFIDTWIYFYVIDSLYRYFTRETSRSTLIDIITILLRKLLHLILPPLHSNSEQNILPISNKEHCYDWNVNIIMKQFLNSRR